MMGKKLYLIKKIWKVFSIFLRKKSKLKKKDLVYQMNFKIIKYKKNREFL
jgi:hypothetical protein